MSLWPWLWPKVTNFNRVRGNAVRNYSTLSASKSVHWFDRHFVHKRTHTHTQTDKLKWKYNPSTISWRCKNCTKFIPRGNSYCRLKSTFKYLGLSLITGRTITRYWYTWYGHLSKQRGWMITVINLFDPSTNRSRRCLTQLYQYQLTDFSR